MTGDNRGWAMDSSTVHDWGSVTTGDGVDDWGYHDDRGWRGRGPGMACTTGDGVYYRGWRARPGRTVDDRG